MANTPYEQITNAVGDYSGVSTAMTDAVTVQLVDGLTISLTADRTYWVNGPLTYTVAIGNTSGIDYETPDLTDTLETTVVSFVDDSVEIDGTPAQKGTAAGEYEYTEATGALVVHLPTVTDGGSTTVTFQVERV